MTSLLDTCREIIRLGKEADPGPWESNIRKSVTGITEHIDVTGEDPYMPGKISVFYYRKPEKNCRLIAYYRNHCPAIAERLIVVEAQLEAAMRTLKYIAPMEEPELHPCTRISKAATRCRDTIAKIQEMERKCDTIG